MVPQFQGVSYRSFGGAIPIQFFPSKYLSHLCVKKTYSKNTSTHVSPFGRGLGEEDKQKRSHY